MHGVRLIQTEAEDLMRDNEYEVDSSSVFDLVHCDCSAYDCSMWLWPCSWGLGS
jgi:hypothetical protein